MPKSLQEKILKLLHANHDGFVKIKQLARRTVFWFGINADIEQFVKSCGACNQMLVTPKKKVDSS